MLKVINFFAEPSAGKSTTAAGLFFLMKQAGCRVELVTEYAKELTWEKDCATLRDQEIIFKEQARRQRRLEDGNMFCITDSPLVLGIGYAQFYNIETKPKFPERVMREFSRYENFNLWVKRTRPYRNEGRNEDASVAEKIHYQLREVLCDQGINPFVISSDMNAPWKIFYMLKQWYPKELGEVAVPSPTFLDVSFPEFKTLF
jgi:hypothetical protein